MVDPTKYHSIVGGFHYLTLTQPNTAFVVNQGCQYMHAPTNTHWLQSNVSHTFLKESISFGLHHRPSTLNFIAYYDADWIDDLMIDDLQMDIVSILDIFLFHPTLQLKLNIIT